MKKKLLIFHPVIAPYRIDFFNEFSKHFDAEICLYWRNLKNQKFDYQKIGIRDIFLVNSAMEKIVFAKE